MARLIRHVPVLASTGWIVLGKLTGYGSVHTQLLALLLTAASLFSIRQLAAKAEASPIHKGMALFTAAASVSGILPARTRIGSRRKNAHIRRTSAQGRRETHH